MAASIDTPRLRLREIVSSDLDFLAEMLGDPDVMRYYPTTLDRAGARAWMQRQQARYARDGHGLWLVERRADRVPLGQVGLMAQTLDDGVHPEIAYLVHRPHQRRGYAYEAAAAVRGHAFRVLGRDYVVSFIRPENTPSQRVAFKLGMVPTRNDPLGGSGPPGVSSRPI